MSSVDLKPPRTPPVVGRNAMHTQDEGARVAPDEAVAAAHGAAIAELEAAHHAAAAVHAAALAAETEARGAEREDLVSPSEIGRCLLLAFISKHRSRWILFSVSVRTNIAAGAESRASTFSRVGDVEEGAKGRHSSWCPTRARVVKASRECYGSRTEP